MKHWIESVLNSWKDRVYLIYFKHVKHFVKLVSLKCERLCGTGIRSCEFLVLWFVSTCGTKWNWILESQKVFDIVIFQLRNFHEIYTLVVFFHFPSLRNCYIIITLESCIHASDGCYWWCNGKEITVLTELFKHCEVKDKLIQVICLRYLFGSWFGHMEASEWGRILL